MSKAKRYYSTIRHCPDDVVYVCNKGYFQHDDEKTDPVHFELPYPLHSPTSYEGPDTVQKIFEDKEEYSKLKKYARPHAASIKKTVSQFKSDSVSLPLGVLNLYKAEMPDLFMDCDYNFYHTGGSLECVSCGGIEYLIRPNNKNELYAYDLYGHGDAGINFKTSTPVMNLKAAYGNNGIFLMTRELNELNVIFTTNISSEVVKPKWKNKSPTVPFVDAKLNNFNTSIAASVLADFSLNIYDINRNKICKSFAKEQCANTLDCFSQIEFLEENILLFANRNTLKLFDCRSAKVMEELDLNLEPCNSVCCFNTLGDSSVFLTTRHDLCRYDLRKLDSNCLHSSHLMSAAPCYMDITECSDDTFIVLSSQKFDQKVLFGTESLNKLPARIPSLVDTLKECRLQKDLLLRDDLEKHLSYSVTGIKLIENDNSKFIFSTNCSGQIFQQRIHSEPLSIHEPIDRFYDWLNKLPDTDKALRVTGIAEMSDVYFKMLKSHKKADSPPSTEQNNNCNKFIRKFSALYRKENFCSMMNELVSIWDVDDDFVDDKTLPEVHSNSKVADWIDSQAFGEDDENK